MKFIFLITFCLFLSAKEELRIISLTPAVTQTIIDLDEEKNIVGVSRFCKITNQKTQVLGDYFLVNEEALLALKPTIVFVSPTHFKTIRILKENSINYEIIKTNTIQDILSSIQVIGERIKQEKKAQKIITNIKNTLTQLKKQIKEKKSLTYLIVIGLSQNLQKYYIVGQDKYFGDILNYLQARNCYEGSTPYPQISMEGIIKLNPTIIVTITNGISQDILNRENFFWKKQKELQAIKNNRYYILNNRSLLLPGSQLNKVLKLLTKTIRPNWLINYAKN